MARDTTTATRLPRDLGGGLVLRRATKDDTEAVADFNARVHRGEGEAWSDPPSEGLAAWTRDLMGVSHPTCRAGDFTVVEDTRARRIVSSLCLIPQTWTYGGVPFGVGQPEIVGTHPDYRRRGLVRAQIEIVHGWSAERGDLLQAITGIRWYYRQFGYELGGLTRGGGRSGYSPQNVPRHSDGAAEPYRFRGATEADIPLLSGLYARRTARDLVACARDEAAWR